MTDEKQVSGTEAAALYLTHIDRARLQRLGIDPAQFTVEPDRRPCDICGQPVTASDGIVGVELCTRYECLDVAYDRALSLLDALPTVDHGDGLKARVEELEARMAKAMDLRGHPDGLKSAWGRGYEDALADVRATLRGDL